MFKFSWIQRFRLDSVFEILEMRTDSRRSTHRYWVFTSSNWTQNDNLLYAVAILAFALCFPEFHDSFIETFIFIHINFMIKMTLVIKWWGDLKWKLGSNWLVSYFYQTWLKCNIKQRCLSTGQNWEYVPLKIPRVMFTKKMISLTTLKWNNNI